MSVPGGPSPEASRQPALAAKPGVFLGLKLRHRQQMTENAELMAPGEPHEVFECFADEGHGLLGASLSGRLLGR